ncbi:MAG: Ig-like domain-containing protein [Thermoplasmata archaeon]|nr:Ig-like domain-containing protein [Thermoplasmata archaeon]
MGRRRGVTLVGPVVLSVALLVVSGVAAPALREIAHAPPVSGGPAPAVTASTLHGGPVRPTFDSGLRPAVGGEGRVLTTTSDPAAVPNAGLRLNVTDFASTPLPPNSAYQLGVEEVIGAYEAVFGLFENPSTAAVPFFSVFTNLTDQNVHLAYWPGLTLIPGESYDFQLVRTNGTNWTLTVDGALFAGNRSAGVFDFGAASATWLASIGFSQVALFPATPFLPAVVTVPLAMAVLAAGGWYLPNVATTTFTGAPSAQWGVEGRLQHPTLAPGELETGSQIANVTNGTALWTGGPVPVRVGASCASAQVVGTVPVGVTVIVTSVGGAPLPGVTVYLHDAQHGQFTPASTMTNGTGGGTTLFLTPNVSATLSDPVTAQVTLFGYVGRAVVAIELTPPAQVFLAAAPSSPVLAPGGQVELAFRAQDGSGATVAGAFVAFSASGNAALAPPAGVTDGSGRVTVNITAGPSTTPFTLTATVTGVGKWGSTQVVVTVRAAHAHPNPLAPLAPYLFLIGVALVVAFAVYLRSRRRRPVPAMALKEYARRPEPAGPLTPVAPGPADPGSVSRTPPSGGSP